MKRETRVVRKKAMPRKGGGVNEKKAAGNERKAVNAAAKLAQAEREQEKANAVEWKKGANNRGAARNDAAAERADEAAKKRQEKALLLKAEEEANKGIEGKAKRVSGVKSKKKKKAGDSFSLLEEALVGDADKKAKAAKKSERVRKEREERLRLEKEKQKATELSKIDPLLRNTDAMLEGAVQDGSSLNTALKDGSSGIDGALDSLSIKKQEDKHPEKRMKALHKAFEERMMPQMKIDYPGLRMSQYKERIFLLWKKSPENPKNWPKTDSS